MDAEQLALRLVRALVEDGATLAGGDARAVWLSVADGGLVAVLAEDGAPEGGAPRESTGDLAALVARAVSALERGALHVVVCGGDASTDPVLAALHPSWRPRRRYTFHRVDGNGARKVVAGNQRSQALDRALARLDEVAPFTAEEMAALAERAAPALAGEHRFARAVGASFPVATVALGAFCALMYVVEVVLGGGTLAHLRMGVNSGRLVREGEVWRLWASCFLHANFLHLFFNLLALASLGPFLEAVLGRPRYVVLYALSGLGGALASALGHPLIYSLGASGAIFGLMGAGVGLVLQPRGLLPPATAARMKRQVWAPVAFNLVYSLQAGIDLLAHLGGGLIGLGLVGAGLATLGLRPVEADGGSRRSRLARALAALSCAAMAASVVAAFAVGKPWELRWPGAPVPRPLAGSTLTIDLPPGLAPGGARGGGPVAISTFGDLARDPLAVETFTKQLDGEVPPSELPAAIAGLRADLAEAHVKGMTPKGEARVVDLGGRPAAFIEGRLSSGVDYASWLTVVGRYVVAVRVYSQSEGLPAWKRLQGGLAAGVRDHPARR